MPDSPADASLLSRYIRFCVVGASGVVLDMALLWLFTSPAGLGWNLSLGKVLAAEGAMLSNFAWNDVWTFRHRRGEPAAGPGRLARFVRFNLICSVGIALSVLLLRFQVERWHFNVYAANLLAIVAASVWNFAMSRVFGWPSYRAAEDMRP